MHGIPVVKFILAADTFSNGTVCPGNRCYNNNLHTGVLNVTQCKVKSPAFVSRPHFHLADPFYQVQQISLHVDSSPVLRTSSSTGSSPSLGYTTVRSGWSRTPPSPSRWR